MKASPAYERELRKWKSRELLDADEEMEKLLSSPGWQLVTELLAKGKQNVELAMNTGPTLEQADYSRLHGFISGLEQAHEAVQAIRAVAASRREKLETEAAVAAGEE